MFNRLAFFAALLAIIFAVTGCGGSGVSDADIDPNGAFAMSMSSSNDGTIVGRQFAIEMASSKGKITKAFARLIGTGTFEGETTTDVAGTAEPGFIDLVAHFSTFRVELEAEFNGLTWNGQYTIWDGTKLIDEGSIDVARADSTSNIEGVWEGEFDFDGKVVVAELEFEQKGNEIYYEGTVDGKTSYGYGSVIGRSVNFDLRFDIDAGFPNFLGNVNSSGARMTGEGIDATFDLENTAAAN